MHSILLKLYLLNFDQKLILLVQILKLFTSFDSIYLTHNENCSTEEVSDVLSASLVKLLALLTLVTSFIKIISSQVSFIWFSIFHLIYVEFFPQVTKYCFKFLTPESIHTLSNARKLPSLHSDSCSILNFPQSRCASSSRHCRSHKINVFIIGLSFS